MSVAVDDELIGAEFTQSHGAACMKAVGGDANFGSESKLETVCKACTGIPVDGRCVDCTQKCFCVCGVGSDNCIAVATAIGVNCVYGGFEVIDFFY